MRRRDPIRIGDALNDFFTSTPTIARKIAEARIPDVWPRVVGDIVASYTVRLEIKTGGRLFVYLSSSVVRNEIFMQRAALKEAINRAVGSDILTTDRVSRRAPTVKYPPRNSAAPFQRNR